MRRRHARPLTWVFPYSETGTAAFRDQLLVAVQSALEKTTLRPVCIFSGSLQSTSARWLSHQGVSLIQHNLSFEAELRQILASSISPNVSLVHLVSTFVRVDVPIMDAFEDEEVVLFTDVNVLFLSDVRTSAMQLPTYIACGAEDEVHDRNGCNGGVMLLNIASMRHSHSAFVKYILSSPGLNFPRGTLEQVSFSSFYNGKVARLPLQYIWRPYWQSAPDVRILHFYGPTPADLLLYVHNRTLQSPFHKKHLDKCDLGNGCALHLAQFQDMLLRSTASYMRGFESPG